MTIVSNVYTGLRRLLKYKQLMEIDLIELFSGCGGFAKGLEEAGFKIRRHFFSEINQHAIANYNYNFKDANYVGSVKHVRHIIRTVGNKERKTVITFGSPCQNFSLVGNGAGLSGDKSSLIKYALFLVRWLRPDIFIWENVKGAFSTNAGADYWAITKAFAGLHGYRHEQQLLNSAWTSAQHRERIYHVGRTAAAGGSGRAIFPITEQDIICYRSGKAKEALHTDHKISLTQLARQYANWAGDFIEVDGRLRQLTEIETERLMGFRDDWTRYGIYNGEVREISERQRYQLCGNAVSVGTVRLIGSKLLNEG